MAVYKQYIVERGSWYEWVGLYEDGVRVGEQRIALTDTNLDTYALILEEQGYVRAYTDREIEECEQKLARLQARCAEMHQNRLLKVGE